MGKKNVNPADAQRKAERKKELKKNKAERQKTRDFALVKKDTRDIEEEIEQLESLPEKNATQRSRLSELKTELGKINKKKEEYVAEHPEQRKLVYRSRYREDRKDGETAPAPVVQKRNLFNKNGLPRHPERSIYYDPVMNPYGVAPPGMPYVERPLRPGEVNSDEEPAEDNDDDDIVMPAGPPPGTSADANEDDSDDDIPMPEGPPPGSVPHAPPLPPLPPPLHPPSMPPLPSHLPPFPPTFPPPPAGFPQSFPFPPPPPTLMPPPGFLPQFPPPPNLPPHGLPRPPPGFFPRNQAPGNMQDPLSSVPHQTYQAHRQAKQQPPPPAPGPSTLPSAHPSLPAKPNGQSGQVPSSSTTPTPAAAPSAAVVSAATVFAEPELRDFKKESTAFVPASLKRKKAGGGASSSKINAAPALGPSSAAGVDESGRREEEPVGPARPNLMDTLKNNLGLRPLGSAGEDEPPSKRVKAVQGPKDDYERFLEDMGDVLGPSS